MLRFTRFALLVAIASLVASCGKSAPSWNSSSAPVATPSANSVLLRWNPVTLPNLSGYHVYYGTASRAYMQPFGQGLTSSTNALTVTGLTGTKRYFFAVTATDSLGNESAYSDEVAVDLR